MLTWLPRNCLEMESVFSLTQNNLIWFESFGVIFLLNIDFCNEIYTYLGLISLPKP